MHTEFHYLPNQFVPLVAITVLAQNFSNWIRVFVCVEPLTIYLLHPKNIMHSENASLTLSAISTKLWELFAHVWSPLALVKHAWPYCIECTQLTNHHVQHSFTYTYIYSSLPKYSPTNWQRILAREQSIFPAQSFFIALLIGILTISNKYNMTRKHRSGVYIYIYIYIDL